MRGSQLLRGAARAAGGYTEKTVPWDSASSGLRGVGDIGHVLVGGVAGAALVFFGLPTLYGSKKPSTFSKEHVNAMKMREHAKERVGAPGEPIGRNPFSNKIAPAEYLNPPEVYRQGLEE